MNKSIDKYETMILTAMGAGEKLDSRHNIVLTSDEGSSTAIIDQGTLLKFRDMSPGSSYTFDAVDSGRLFTTHKDYLIRNPIETIGDEAETIMMYGDTLKWWGLKRTTKRDKSVSVLGKPFAWYEFHVRFIASNGAETYLKRIIPVNKNGCALPAKIQGQFVCSPRYEGETFNLIASVIEDAHRANTMLAKISEECEIKLPVPVDDYKAMFFDRDGPMANAKKKAIIHWVAKHLRKSTKGNMHEVKRHVRGVDKITIDGITISIIPNND